MHSNLSFVIYILIYVYSRIIHTNKLLLFSLNLYTVLVLFWFWFYLCFLICLLNWMNGEADSFMLICYFILSCVHTWRLRENMSLFSPRFNQFFSLKFMSITAFYLFIYSLLLFTFIFIKYLLHFFFLFCFYLTLSVFPILSRHIHISGAAAYVHYPYLLLVFLFNI